MGRAERSSIKGVTYSHLQSLGYSKATGRRDTQVLGFPFASFPVFLGITYASG